MRDQRSMFVRASVLSAALLIVGAWAPAAGATAGATKTWAAPGTSGSWDDAAKWGPPGVPASTDAVLLPEGTYTVTATHAEVTSVTVGHGVTVDLESENGFGVLGAGESIVDHGTIHVNTAGGALILVTSTSIDVASDGTLIATGDGSLGLRGDVANRGSVSVDTTVGCCGNDSTFPAAWTNFAGSTTVVRGALQIGPESQTIVHQAGATLTVDPAGSLLVGGTHGSPFSNFVDDGGTINGTIGLAYTYLQLNAGTTGDFDVHETSNISGTIARGQRVTADPESGLVQLLSFPPLLNHGELVATASNPGDQVWIGQLSNAADGVMHVQGEGNVVLFSDFDNAGTLDVATPTTLRQLGCVSSCASVLKWTNELGSITTIHGLVQLDNDDMVHETGARLDIDATTGHGLLLDDPSARFTDNGGVINGRVDIAIGGVNLNAGNTGTFVVHGFSYIIGTISSGQTVDVVSGPDGFGNARSAELGSIGPLTNHGTIRLSSTSDALVSAVTSDLVSDGVVRAEAAGGHLVAIQSFTNAGTVAVDAGVTLLVVDHYVQQSTGTFDTSVASGSSFGQLRVGGPTTPSGVDQPTSLSGTLHVTLTNGYVPHAGEHRDVVIGARAGTKFTTANTAGYNVNYGAANKITLTKPTCSACAKRAAAVRARRALQVTKTWAAAAHRTR